MTARLAKRSEAFPTFNSVSLFKERLALAAAGRHIINMGIGEPDFTAPQAVTEALRRATEAGLSSYTAPAGITPLREAIARYYDDHFGTKLDPSRVIVTAGASGALILACAALIDTGSEVLLPAPSYSGNSSFIVASGGRATFIPTTAENRFQMSADDVRQHWKADTRGVLISSPSNPTGTSIEYEKLRDLLAEVRSRDGFTIMDEIYLGLSYDAPARSALTLDDDVIVINSFSKFFHMTGWRLGWMIVPQEMVSRIEPIASCLAICAPTLAQHAALACFEPQTMAIYEERRDAFHKRRDFLVPALEELGFSIPARPDGAFYVYADIGNLAPDSATFAYRLLREAGVSTLPGTDFGDGERGQRMLRLSYCTGIDELQEAVRRMGNLLG